jgi:hypothetical protein
LRGDFNGKIVKRRGERDKKIQRLVGKCRWKETDGMVRRKWMRGVEREQTRKDSGWCERKVVGTRRLILTSIRLICDMRDTTI